MKKTFAFVLARTTLASLLGEEAGAFSHFVVRGAEAADLERLAEREAEVEATPWGEAAFADALRVGRPVLVLENPSDPEGFAAWAAYMPVLDEAELLIFGVRRDMQRRGLATSFLRATLRALQAEGCGVVHLEVRRSNAPAIGLYEKLGFKTSGLRKGYYLVNGRREDAILMRLDLAPAASEPAA